MKMHSYLKHMTAHAWRGFEPTMKVMKIPCPSNIAKLEDVAAGSTTIIELGPYCGTSSKIMLKANPSLELYCVDRWEDHDSYSTFRSNVYEHRDRCFPVRIPTLEGLRACKDGGVIPDAIYIHASAHILEDIRLCQLFFPLASLLGNASEELAVQTCAREYGFEACLNPDGWHYRREEAIDEEIAEAQFRIGKLYPPHLIPLDFHEAKVLPLASFNSDSGWPLDLCLFRFYPSAGLQMYKGGEWIGTNSGEALFGRLSGLFSAWDGTRTIYLPCYNDCAQSHVLSVAKASSSCDGTAACEVQQEGALRLAYAPSPDHAWAKCSMCSRDRISAGNPFLGFAHARHPRDSGVALFYDLTQTLESMDCALLPHARLAKDPPLAARDLPNSQRAPKAVFAGREVADTVLRSGTPIDVDGNVNLKIHRADFVHRFRESPLVDCEGQRTREEQCKYRIIVVLEGHDIGSALYWAFGSGSVPFLPEPALYHCVWHYHIKPNIHYIPFNMDNLESTISRVLADQQFCDRIVQNAKQVHAKVTDADRDRRICAYMLAMANQEFL